MVGTELQAYQKHDILGYYKLLNLNPNATPAEIRRAYYGLALLYHPDKNSSEEAEVMFKAIVQAYDVLSDPEKRGKYDALTYVPNPTVPATDFEREFLPSFLLGTLLGNVFIYGASVGIIVCPLWGWVVAPTLLVVVVSPILRATKCTKLSGLCWGFALSPITDILTVTELSVKFSKNIVSSAVGMITGLVSKPKHQIEDIDEGWVDIGEE